VRGPGQRALQHDLHQVVGIGKLSRQGTRQAAQARQQRDQTFANSLTRIHGSPLHYV
jgi:hypothetical protein